MLSANFLAGFFFSDLDQDPGSSLQNYQKIYSDKKHSITVRFPLIYSCRGKSLQNIEAKATL
jgi:hypothetical protein